MRDEKGRQNKVEGSIEVRNEPFCNGYIRTLCANEQTNINLCSSSWKIFREIIALSFAGMNIPAQSSIVRIFEDYAMHHFTLSHYGP